MSDHESGDEVEEIKISDVKNEIVKKELNKKYSYKQIFRMLSKYKKVKTDKNKCKCLGKRTKYLRLILEKRTKRY